MKSKIDASKTLKNSLLLVLVTVFLISCGGDKGTVTTTDPTSSTPTETTATDETTSNSTEAIQDASGKITAVIVKQVCDCQEGARQEDGSIDYPKVGECMGGKNKIKFIADLLGPDATDKQRADAENTLTKKMAAKCPE
jgi:hypothetical protein